MKKVIRFIVLAVAALTMCLFVGCGEEECTHTYATDWTSDATMHWHAGTCECGVKNDVAGHTDANDDGACDACAYYDANHTHTYAEAWSSDKDNHWHESTCYHTVVADVAAHTADKLGNCTVCGYKVGEPDLSTVAKAIAIGAGQKAEVKAGIYVDEFDESTVSYEFHDSYTYIKENAAESYYSLVNEETAFGVKRIWDSYEWAWMEENIPLAVVENMWGPEIDGSYVGADSSFYGAEDLLVNAYEIASDNINGDFTQEIHEGAFMFAFGFKGDYGLYKIQVGFTLDKDSYYIDLLAAYVEIYGDGSYEEVAPAAGENPAQYAPVAGAEPFISGEVYFAQSNAPISENPYSVEEMVVTDFAIVNEYYEPVSTITLEAGVETTLYFDVVAPETGKIEYATISFAGELIDNEDWFEEGTVTTNYEGGNDYFTLKSLMLSAGTTTQLTITVNGVAKTYTINIVEPVPTTIVAGYYYYDSEIWEDVFAPLRQPVFEMYAGENKKIAACANRAGVELAMQKDNINLSDTDYELLSVYDEVFGYLDTYAYDLSTLAPGQYEFAFADLVNELYSYVTVVINATPTPADILNDKIFTYMETTGTTMWGAEYVRKTEFIFTEVAKIPVGAKGAVSIVVTDGESYMGYDQWYTDDAETTDLYFVCNNGEILFFTDEACETAATVAYSLMLDDSYNLNIGVMSFEYEPMYGQDYNPSAATAFIGDYEYITTSPAPSEGVAAFYGYLITLNDDGTGSIVYDAKFEGIGWRNVPEWTVNFTYTVSDNPMGGYLIAMEFETNTQNLSGDFVGLSADGATLNGNMGLTMGTTPLAPFTKVE